MENIQEHSNNRFNIYSLLATCGGMALLLIVRDLFGLPIHKFVLLAFCVAAFFVLSYKNMISFICFLLPLSCGIPGNYIMMVALIMLLLKRSQSIGLIQIAITLFVVVQELILDIFYPGISIVAIAGYLAHVALLFFLIYDKNTEIDFKTSIIGFFVGVTVLLLTIFLNTLNTYSFSELLDGAYRIGVVDEAISTSGIVLTLSNNANAIAYYSLLSVACFYCLILELEKKSLFLVPIVLFDIFVGFLTISRSFVIFLVVLSAVYALSLFFKRYKFKNAVFVLVLAVLIIWVITSQTGLLEAFGDRFMEDSMETGGGRTEVFDYYFKFLFSDPLRLVFGSGAVYYGKAVPNAPGAMHNGLQQILFCYGIIGFVVWIGAFTNSIVKARGGRRIEIAYYIPILAVVFFTQTIQFLSPYELMMPFIIGIFAVSMGRQRADRRALAAVNG